MAEDEGGQVGGGGGGAHAPGRSEGQRRRVQHGGAQGRLQRRQVGQLRAVLALPQQSQTRSVTQQSHW